MAHDSVARFIRNLTLKKGLGKRVFAGFRTKLVPIAVLREPNLRNILVGFAADLGKREQEARKDAGRPFIRKVNERVSDVAALVPELVFTILAEAFGALDAATDKASEGLIEDLTDIPEEALREASLTLAALARALRTGRRNNG